MGRSKSLGSWKSLLWYTPWPSRVSIWLFSTLNPLRVHSLGQLQWPMACWPQPCLLTDVAGSILVYILIIWWWKFRGSTVFHFGCYSMSLCWKRLWNKHHLCALQGGQNLCWGIYMHHLRGIYTYISYISLPGMREPGGLPSMGLHRVGHDWSDLAVAILMVGSQAKGDKFTVFGVRARYSHSLHFNACHDGISNNSMLIH